jgi:hypothetical protein
MKRLNSTVLPNQDSHSPRETRIAFRIQIEETVVGRVQRSHLLLDLAQPYTFPL